MPPADPALPAETVAKALGGRKAGASWMARGPAHEDREPSLSIKETDSGKVLVHCHTGCDQQQVIAALKSLGIWYAADRDRGTLIHPQPSSITKNERDRDDSKRMQAALRMWRATVRPNGTLVETYLRFRGIVMPVPVTLRFHPGIKHPCAPLFPPILPLLPPAPAATPPTPPP